MAVSEAERTAADLRMADLVAAQAAAWRRHCAAKCLVTRALKDGDAAKTAAAHERKRQAYAEFEAVSDASIGEMFGINRAGPDRLGELNEQIGRTWAADSGRLDEMLGRMQRPGNERSRRPVQPVPGLPVYRTTRVRRVHAPQTPVSTGTGRCT